MPLLLLLLAAPLGVLVHANLAVRREGSPLHRKLSALANTGKRPPAALAAPGLRALADEGDFGSGIARHCGCQPANRRTLPARASFPEPLARPARRLGGSP